MTPTTGQLSRYAAALCLVAAAFLLRFSIEKMAGPVLPTYFTFYPCVMFSALLLGLGPGLLATFASALLAGCIIAAPYTLGHWNVREAASIILFSGTGIFMCLVAHRYNLIRSRLKILVEERTDKISRANDEELLRFLGTCGYKDSGEDFFQELARYLAQALTMDFVCIDRLEEGSLSAQTLAVFYNGKFEDNVSYTLKDTPCGDVVGQNICCFPKDVRGLFPKDDVLQDLQAESYLGATLWNAQGKPIGLIAVIGRQPLSDIRIAESILQIVAVRAAGELERRLSEESLQRQELALKKSHDELEHRVVERTNALAETVETLLTEISEREKAERGLLRLNRLYAVLSETNQAIVRISDRDTLFQDFSRIAVEQGGFLLSWVGLVDEMSGKVCMLAASGATSYLDAIRTTAGEYLHGEGPTGISIRTGTHCICNDFQNDPRTRPWHERGRTHGIKASASVALKDNERVIGALALYAGEKDFFDQQHVDLLVQMGKDISFAIDNLNREECRQEAEKALQEETIKRLQAVESLRKQELVMIQQNRHAAMGEMIGNIAHQWRQPLNTLGLFTQSMGFFYGTPRFNKEFLDTSIAKTMEIIQFMSRTIDDFRNFFSTER